MDQLLENAIAINGLLGLGELNVDELLGYVGKNPARFKKQLQSARPPAAIVNNSRSAIIGKYALLGDDLRKGLASGSLQLVDSAFMVIKSISGKSEIKMLQDADVKKAGICMINGGKLEKGEAFLMNEIILVSGQGDGIEETVANISPAKFGLLEQMLVNGEFEFKGNGKTLIPRMSMEVFNNAFIGDGMAFSTGNGRVVGSFKLDNPKLIETQTSMEFNAEWGAAALENLFLKLVLRGSRVYKH